MDFLAIGEGWESVNIQDELFDAVGGFLAGDNAPNPILANAAFAGAGGVFGGADTPAEMPIGVAIVSSGGGVLSAIVPMPSGGLFTASGGGVISGDWLAQYEEFIAEGGLLAGGAAESFHGGLIDASGGTVAGGTVLFTAEAFLEAFGGGIISGVNWPAAEAPDGRIDDDSGPRRGRYKRSRPSGSIR